MVSSFQLTRDVNLVRVDNDETVRQMMLWFVSLGGEEKRLALSIAEAFLCEETLDALQGKDLERALRSKGAIAACRLSIYDKDVVLAKIMCKYGFDGWIQQTPMRIGRKTETRVFPPELMLCLQEPWAVEMTSTMAFDQVVKRGDGSVDWCAMPWFVESWARYANEK